jgi:hypothetical protein
MTIVFAVTAPKISRLHFLKAVRDPPAAASLTGLNRGEFGEAKSKGGYFCICLEPRHPWPRPLAKYLQNLGGTGFADELENTMRILMSQIEVSRNFQGSEFTVPVEVWNTPEGICARSLANIFYRDGGRVLLLLEADEDPQLDDHEMDLAEDSLWVVRNFDPHVP